MLIITTGLSSDAKFITISKKATVMCSGGEEDDCHVVTDEFINLKTDDGIAYEVIEETEEEEIERVFAEDYEMNFWEFNPRY